MTDEFAILLEKNPNVFFGFLLKHLLFLFLLFSNPLISVQSLLITDSVHSNFQKHVFTYSQPHTELITGTLKNLKGVLYCGIKSKFKDKLIGAGL